MKRVTLDYLSHTSKMGELATRYTWSSVILLHDEYRRQQAAYRFHWGSDTPQLGLSSRPRRQVFSSTSLGYNHKTPHSYNHKAKLSVDFHKDIKWWLKYLQTFKGVVYYRHVDHAVVHTDACNIGGGAFFNGDWVTSTGKGTFMCRLIFISITKKY